jgi:hypothetical protein
MHQHMQRLRSQPRVRRQVMQKLSDNESTRLQKLIDLTDIEGVLVKLELDDDSTPPGATPPSVAGPSFSAVSALSEVRRIDYTNFQGGSMLKAALMGESLSLLAVAKQAAQNIKTSASEDADDDEGGDDDDEDDDVEDRPNGKRPKSGASASSTPKPVPKPRAKSTARNSLIRKAGDVAPLKC